MAGVGGQRPAVLDLLELVIGICTQSSVDAGSSTLNPPRNP